MRIAFLSSLRRIYSNCDYPCFPRIGLALVRVSLLERFCDLAYLRSRIFLFGVHIALLNEVMDIITFRNFSSFWVACFAVRNSTRTFAVISTVRKISSTREPSTSASFNQES
jgi:hypothetical protein